MAQTEYQQPFKTCVFWKTPSEILLCNSPELFLNITAKGHIESLPIKGTHGDVSDPNSYRTLWESPKERAELTMIVDMMRNDISIVAEYGSVKASERQIRQCGDLLHAEQRVHGQIRDDISTLQLFVHACFPPASVTGAPKDQPSTTYETWNQFNEIGTQVVLDSWTLVVTPHGMSSFVQSKVHQPNIAA